MRITGARRKIETAAAIQGGFRRSWPEGRAESLLADGHFAPADACALTDTPMALTGIRLRSGGCMEDTEELSIPQVAVR
jgi:hypothetical protein